MEQYTIKPQGHCTKSLTMRTSAGTFRYNLTPNGKLGLPKDAYIYGVVSRSAGDDARSINNVATITADAREGGYLTLLDTGTNAVLSNYPILYLDNEVCYFEPRKVREFDFVGSHIQFTQAVSAEITGGKDIELTFLYCMDKEHIPPTGMRFDGAKLPPIRSNVININLNTTDQIYSLSKANAIGLGENDIVIGFDFRTPAFSIDGIAAATGAVLSAAFLNLKEQSTLFVENTPLQVLTDSGNALAAHYSREYFPTRAVSAADIDWQGSNIKISNAAALAAVGYISMNVLYYRNDY